MSCIWQVTHCDAGVFCLFSMQRFAGASKHPHSGNRSMSYLAGKADRCVSACSALISAGVFSCLCPGATGKAELLSSIAVGA